MKNKIHPVFFMLIMLCYSLISFNTHAASTDGSASSCYPNLPKLNISVSGVEEYGVGDELFMRFLISTTNNASIPAELFFSAPHLPACGQNRNSARSWVGIFDGSTNDYLYGFCALGGASDLNDLWFPIKKGEAIPEDVYIEINDRECRVSYKSNIIPVSPDDIPLVGNGCKGLTQLTCDSLAEVDELFDWAADTYPDLFEQEVKTSPVSDLFVRHYLKRNLYLGSRNRKVYGLGDIFGGGVVQLGTLDGLLSEARKGTTASCTDSEKLENGHCVAQTCEVDKFDCPSCKTDETLTYDKAGKGSCEVKPPECSKTEKLVGKLCVAQTCEVDKFNCPSCKTDETLTYDKAGKGSCEVKPPECSKTEKLTGKICVPLTCKTDKFDCPSCKADETLTFNKVGKGSCEVNLPKCSAAEKLVGKLCVAKTCLTDKFNCPSCKTNETLTYDKAGKGSCEINLPTCSASEKLVGKLCVAKTCEVDGFNCPDCTANETLIYDSTGAGICEINIPTCSAGEKLDGNLCVAKSCEIDNFNCPDCSANETLTYNAAGAGICETNVPTCLASEKLDGNLCVAKSCEIDNFNCPDCSANETLTYNAAGAGICEINTPTCSDSQQLKGNVCVDVDVAPTLISTGLTNASYYANNSYLDSTPEKPFNNEGSWGSGSDAGWIEIDLGKPYDVTSIELVVDQSPEGETVHEIWLSGNPIEEDRSSATLLTTLTGVTDKFDTLKQSVTSKAKVQFIQVNTVSTPSWVGWVSIKVYGK